MENHRRQSIGLNRAAQKFARRKNVLLPDKFLERARPHPRRERRGRVELRKIDIFLAEKIRHELICRHGETPRNSGSERADKIPRLASRPAPILQVMNERAGAQ